MRGIEMARLKAIFILALLPLAMFFYIPVGLKAQEVVNPLALYYSERCEEWYDSPPQNSWTGGSIAYSAWYEAIEIALDAYDVDYETIYVDEVEDALGTDYLNQKYDVIYLHSGFAQPLSDLEKWSLANFTWNGGSIIGTHHVGVYNDTDMVYPSNRQFWYIFGVEPVPGMDPGDGSQSVGSYDTVYANPDPLFDEIFGGEGSYPVDFSEGVTVGNPYWKQIYVVETTTATTLAQFTSYLDYPFIGEDWGGWPEVGEATTIEEPTPAVTINEYGQGKAIYYNWEFSKMMAHYWGQGQGEWAEPAGLGCTDILLASYIHLSGAEVSSIWEKIMVPLLVMVVFVCVMIAVITIRAFRSRK